MIVTCGQCTTQFHLDDAKVPEEGIRVRCSRCKHAFLVESPNRSHIDQAEELARTALDSASQDDIESDWQFNEEVPPEPAVAGDLDGRDAVEAAVDDLLGASFGSSLAPPGDREPSLGDSLASTGVGPGGSSAPPGDLEATFSDTDTFPDDFEAGSADSSDATADLEIGFGDPGDALRGRELDSGLDELTPAPDLGSRSASDSQPMQPGEAELATAGADATVDTDFFEDPADARDLSGEDSPVEPGAADDRYIAPASASADAALDLASHVTGAAEIAASSVGTSPGLGEPEERDDEPAPEAASSLRTAEVAIEHVPSSTLPRSARSPLSGAPAKLAIDVSALEADLEANPGNAWFARAGTAVGWSVVCALCAYAGFAGLVPSVPALPADGVSWSIAGLEGHGIQGRWIENAVAGPIYVVSGDLRVGASDSSGPGALLRLRLVDATGRPIAAESAALGAPVPPGRLREWNPRDLRSEQEKSARRLAGTPVQRGERRPFLAILGGVPPTAKGYEITRGE